MQNLTYYFCFATGTIISEINVNDRIVVAGIQSPNLRHARRTSTAAAFTGI